MSKPNAILHRAISHAFCEALESRRLFAHFAMVGDITQGTPSRDVANLIKGWSPDFVVSSGDNVHVDANIDDTIGQYYRGFMSPYPGNYGAGSTTGNNFYSALGNHDYDNGISDDLAFFNFPGNERYYNVRRDNVELFVVNSNSQESAGTTSASTQGQWLKGALAASTAQWKLVIFHYPAYTSGTEDNHTNMQWPFQAWGATAVISGHDHMYERILKGTFPYFVNGLGGANIVPPDHVESGSQVRYSNDYGALMVDTTATSIRFQFITRSGSVKDDYTINAPATTPAAPSGLVATAITASRIDLKWTDNASNETGFILERSPDGSSGWAQIATPATNATTSIDTTGLSASTPYFYRVRATNAFGASANSSVASATTLAASSALPAPWVDSDIGAVGVPGAATVSGGTYTVRGAGADIWGTADAFNFASLPLNGDGAVIARVVSVQDGNAGSFGGVMIRESLNANSAEASLVINGTQVGFLRRSATGASSTSTSASATVPYWLKLQRVGNVFTASRSSNGTTYTTIGSVTIAMGANVFIGLAACSTTTSALAAVTFDNVSITPAPLAWMTGTTLNVQFDGTTSPITLGVSGANITVMRGAATQTFSGVASIAALGTTNSDALQISGALSPALSFANGNGNDSVELLAGSSYTFAADLAASLSNVAVTIDAGATATFASNQHLSNLIVNGTAVVAAGENKVLVTGGLSITGMLDLKDNDLIVDYPSVSPVGTWNGSAYDGVTAMIRGGRGGVSGLVTSSHDGNFTLLGVAESSQVLGASGGVFSGQTIDATAVLVKFTYGGDANLDGKINVDDYTRIDASVSLGLTGYINGDFNLDGKIDVDDYTMIDFNVAIQGAPL